MSQPTHLVGPTRQQLALELGAVRHDRDLLLRKVLAVHAGMDDGTAPIHWRDLLRTAQWMQRCDVKRAAEEVTG